MFFNVFQVVAVVSSLPRGYLESVSAYNTSGNAELLLMLNTSGNADSNAFVTAAVAAFTMIVRRYRF